MMFGYVPFLGVSRQTLHSIRLIGAMDGVVVGVLWCSKQKQGLLCILCSFCWIIVFFLLGFEEVLIIIPVDL